MMPDKCQWCGSTDISRLQEQVQPPPYGDAPYTWPAIIRCRDCGTLHWLEHEDDERWWFITSGNEVNEALTPTHKAAQG